MSDDDKTAQAQLNFIILHRVAGPLLAFSIPEEPPTLGSLFAVRSTRIIGELKQKRSLLLDELMQITGGSPLNWFSKSGEPQNDDAKAWITRNRNLLEAQYRNLSIWSLALFIYDDLADYDYWFKAAYLKVDEVLFLSV